MSQVAIATMHGKERVLAPMLTELGFTPMLASIDTDLLGTFTGHVARPAGPRETAAIKARIGAEALGSRFGIASEGSYRPQRADWDPSVWGGEVRSAEVLAFVDVLTGEAVVETQVNVISRFTNGRVAPDIFHPDLRQLLARIGFPSHAILVAPTLGAGEPPELVRKGIADWSTLAEAMAAAAQESADGLVHVESDMRAHLNPTRMSAIATVAADLSNSLRQRLSGFRQTPHTVCVGRQ